MNILETLQRLLMDSGFVGFFMDGGWKNLIMIAVACLLLYLGIVKKFEPLLLVGIAFGCLLVNVSNFFVDGASSANALYHPELWSAFLDESSQYYHSYGHIMANGGLLDILYIGVKTGLYPSLIFLGIGAMTDFGPLLSNPKSLLLGAAAQMGVFLAFFGAVCIGFTGNQAASIGIIGGADGPTAIFLTSKLAPELLGPIAIAAYSYMALIPMIQPPLMKLLTTEKDRQVKMEQNRQVSKTEKIIFPNLRNVAFRQSLQRLKNLGLNVGRIEYVPSNFKNLVLDFKYEGNIIEPNSLIQKGETVDIVLGNGNTSNDQVAIPSLVGKTLAEAKAILLRAFLNVGEILPDNTVKTETDQSTAIIYQQEPEFEENMTMKMGGDITLYLTKDKEKIMALDSLSIEEQQP